MRHFFVYLEPRGMCLVAETVAIPSGGANSAPRILLLNLRGYFLAGERKGRKEKKRDRSDGRKARPPSNKCLVKALFVRVCNISTAEAGTC